MSEQSQASIDLHDARVRNLIAKVDIRTASAKKRQVIALLKLFPKARRIRFEGKCHCRRGNQLSFVLAQHEFSDGIHERCGYFCPNCGFSNAGARRIRNKKELS